MNISLKGLVAVITGSSAGIGLGIAESLAKNGASVVITSRDQEKADKIATEISSKYKVDTLGVSFNISDSKDIPLLIDACISKFNQLDLLVNNAIDLNALVRLKEANESQLNLAITSNITNVLYLTRLAYPHLKESSFGGNIINISSVVVNRHLLGLTTYSVIKGAINQATKALAAEWAQDGIRVNSINPGFIRTDAYKNTGVSDDIIEQRYIFFTNYLPLGQIGEPKDIGALAAFLASTESKLITGEIFNVDGGYSIQGLPLFDPSKIKGVEP